MIANSSMYNEKQALRYQVDTFKDMLDEHYETLNQAKRQLKEKCKVGEASTPFAHWSRVGRQSMIVVALVSSRSSTCSDAR
jgi:hypothetical protein